VYTYKRFKNLRGNTLFRRGEKARFLAAELVVHDFRGGRSLDAIFEAYPWIGSLAKVYTAITFILEHPKEIEA
jgi:hypothetical protein